MPRVSIIIPTYKRGHILGEALKSVQEQTYKDFEVIIVDDHSQDNGETRKVVEAFGDCNFKYIYLDKNKGPAGARNAALPFCGGEYLSFLDSDDLLLPQKLKKHVSILDSNLDAAMVYSDEYVLGNDGQLSPLPVRANRKPPLPSGFIASEFLRDSFIGTMTVTLRKIVFEEMKGFDESLIWNEDDDLWLRIMIRYKVICSDYPAGIRRLHESSGSYKGNMSKIRDKMVYYQYKSLLKYAETERSFFSKNAAIVKEKSNFIMNQYIRHCIRHFVFPSFESIKLYINLARKIRKAEK
ncbi:MAG: glycosyltransferase family A protein [bacterium]